MSTARRLLIFGCIGLALLVMIYGLWYAIFAEHQELDGIRKYLATGFSAAGARDPRAAEDALQQYRELKYTYDRHVDVHGHWIGLAMLLMVLGIAFDRVELTERMKMLLSAGLLLGSLLFPLGVLLQPFSHGVAPLVVAVAGSAVVTVSVRGQPWAFA